MYDCTTQVLAEVNLLRRNAVRLFAVGLDSQTNWMAVRDLSTAPQIRNMNYFINMNARNLSAISSSVTDEVSLICSNGVTVIGINRFAPNSN